MDIVDITDVVFTAGTKVTGVEVSIPITDTVWLDVVDMVDVNVVFEARLEVSILITDTI